MYLNEIIPNGNATETPDVWAKKTFNPKIAKLFLDYKGHHLSKIDFPNTETAQALLGARYLAVGAGHARPTKILSSAVYHVFNVSKEVRDAAREAEDWAAVRKLVAESMAKSGWLAEEAKPAGRKASTAPATNGKTTVPSVL